MGGGPRKAPQNTFFAVQTNSLVDTQCANLFIHNLNRSSQLHGGMYRNIGINITCDFLHTLTPLHFESYRNMLPIYNMHLSYHLRYLLVFNARTHHNRVGRNFIIIRDYNKLYFWFKFKSTSLVNVIIKYRLKLVRFDYKHYTLLSNKRINSFE